MFAIIVDLSIFLPIKLKERWFASTAVKNQAGQNVFNPQNCDNICYEIKEKTFRLNNLRHNPSVSHFVLNLFKVGLVFFFLFCPDDNSVTIYIEAVNVDIDITRETKDGKMMGKEVQGVAYPVLWLQLFNKYLLSHGEKPENICQYCTGQLVKSLLKSNVGWVVSLTNCIELA